MLCNLLSGSSDAFERKRTTQNGAFGTEPRHSYRPTLRRVPELYCRRNTLPPPPPLLLLLLLLPPPPLLLPLHVSGETMMTRAVLLHLTCDRSLWGCT